MAWKVERILDYCPSVAFHAPFSPSLSSLQRNGRWKVKEDDSLWLGRSG